MTNYTDCVLDVNKKISPTVSELTPKTATVDDILKQLELQGEDKEAKKKIIMALPDDLSTQVIAALKLQKEEKERLARQVDSELEDLL